MYEVANVIKYLEQSNTLLKFFFFSCNYTARDFTLNEPKIEAG